MARFSLSILSLVALVSCAWCAVSFYPYGPGAGDSKLMNSADPAVTLTLPEKYTFYGEEYEKICISDNGYVTFHEPLLTNKPKPFPITSGSYVSQISKMIAPYWADIDTRCGGDIWYRLVTLDNSDNLYWKILIEVVNSGEAYNFRPSSALVVTWEGVTCSNDRPCQDHRRNTFQLVLTSDGMSTIAMFRYKVLEWETSSMNMGPACAGVNAGDTNNGFNVTNDPDDMLNLRLVSMTNCYIPGLFIFRVDHGPGPKARMFLMGKMMEMAVAKTMEFGVAAEAELYSPYADVSAVEFNRHPDVHQEEYVGGLSADIEMVSFYSYGTPEDSTLGSSDEGTSGREYFGKPICFYGKNYTSAIVYTNGYITLDEFYDHPTYIPKDLKETGVPMIAPYFADADTRGRRSGMIYFRGTDDAAMLYRAKTDVEYTYAGVSFTPNYLFIATWDKVGFYNHHDNLLNSYQVVIATDGKTSYVIFNYNRVEWTSPDSMGVPPGAGVGAAPDKLPVLGIGDGFSHEKLIVDTRVESDILDVEINPGNTGLPGVWIFEASLSSSKQVKAQIGEPQKPIEPKMQHYNEHRPSRPYFSDEKGSYPQYPERQAQKDIEKLASELQNAKKYSG